MAESYIARFFTNIARKRATAIFIATGKSLITNFIANRIAVTADRYTWLAFIGTLPAVFDRTRRTAAVIIHAIAVVTALTFVDVSIATSANDYVKFARFTGFGTSISGFNHTDIRATISRSRIAIITPFAAIQCAVTTYTRRQNRFTGAANRRTRIVIFDLAYTGTAISTVFVAIVAFFAFIQDAVATFFDINRRFTARIIAIPARLGRAYAGAAVPRHCIAIVATFTGLDNLIATCVATTAILSVMMDLYRFVTTGKRKRGDT